jgi:hypothetical protein
MTIANLQKDAVNWFFKLIKNLSIRTKIAKPVDFIEPGKMYVFRYDAKHKKTLPYWDAFPLIFPIGLYPDGFLGLNMHYLPYKLRAEFFKELLAHKQNDRLNIDYAKLKTSRFLAFTIHRYLGAHVKSGLYEIATVAWPRVVYLPTQQFQKQTASQVWSNFR